MKISNSTNSLRFFYAGNQQHTYRATNFGKTQKRRTQYCVACPTNTLRIQLFLQNIEKTIYPHRITSAYFIRFEIRLLFSFLETHYRKNYSMWQIKSMYYGNLCHIKTTDSQWFVFIFAKSATLPRNFIAWITYLLFNSLHTKRFACVK